MAGTYAVIGHAINPAGIWLKPPQLIPSLGVAQWSPPDLIPVASLSGGSGEMTALVNSGNATQIG